MRIALVSYEYPPDTAAGGIATYTGQWAKLLFSRGHDVEVFCASLLRSGSTEEDGVLVHRVQEADRTVFKQTILPVFAKRHQWKKFDVVESPEFNADGKLIKQAYPEVKLVVKLHAPSFLVNKINRVGRLSAMQKLRVIAGALRRFRRPSFYWKQSESVYKEEKFFTQAADMILTPSKALSRIISKKWHIASAKIQYLPNPYVPNEEYLKILPAHNDFVVTYVGRLDRLKGILSFIDVVPIVAARFPKVIFRFIGMDSYLQELKDMASNILATKLLQYNNHIEIIGAVSVDQIPFYLGDTSICVFPSLWENFPTVCLEAMSAGRAVVGSKSGGMSEMLAQPKAGILVNPVDVNELATAICFLLDHPDERDKLGAQGRKNVLEKYNAAVIGARFEELVQKVK